MDNQLAYGIRKGGLPILDENMLRMQQEAAERVRKMQERARKFMDDEPAPPVKSKNPALRDHPEPPAPLHIVEEASPQGLVSKRSAPSFLSGLGEDKDQLFLLLIAALLVKNDAPIELILALLYIAM